jgi:tRNA pseudouridine32 synthase/23S rRNA pseudouridine746 synthase
MRLWVVHRIDRDASGVVLFARNAQAHRALSLSFERREAHKTYLAFVSGVLTPARGRIEVPLHPARKGKTRPARPGERGQQSAATDYATKRIWRFGGETVSLVEAHPVTGRHHQIRVHLRSIEAPILFDRLYGRGFAPETLGGAPCSRLALHAHRIELPAPQGGGTLTVEAPLAPDLAALRSWLDANGEGHDER